MRGEGFGVEGERCSAEEDKVVDSSQLTGRSGKR